MGTAVSGRTWTIRRGLRASESHGGRVPSSSTSTVFKQFEIFADFLFFVPSSFNMPWVSASHLHIIHYVGVSSAAILTRFTLNAWLCRHALVHRSGRDIEARCLL